MQHRKFFAVQVIILWAALLSCAHLSAQPHSIKDYKPEEIKQFRYEIIAQNTRQDSLHFLVTVRDSQGNHVGGLANQKEAWFSLSEQANPKKTCKKMKVTEVSEAATLPEPVNFALVLDYSGSMVFHFGALKQRAQAFIEKLRGNKFSRVNFDDRVVVVRPKEPNTNPPSVLKDKFSDYGGTTALYKGILEGIKTLENTPGQRVVIVFSDGLENASGIGINEVIVKAQTNKTVVHAIGFDMEGLELIERPNLIDICERTGGKYYPAEGVGNLAAEFARLGSQFSQYYSVKAACQDVKLPANLKTPVDTATIATIEDLQAKGLFPWNDIAFSTLLFEYNSTQLIKKQKNAIKDLAPVIAAYLLQDSTHTIVLKGYASPDGGSLHNAKLSRVRVDFVYQALYKQIEGLYRGKPDQYKAIFARNRIFIELWGEEKAIFPEKSYKNPENRRVEVMARK